MVVLAKTSNKLIRIRGFHIDDLGHAQSKELHGDWVPSSKQCIRVSG
jgi:hypothetical protein